jgi:hypothetical protein
MIKRPLWKGDIMDKNENKNKIVPSDLGEGRKYDNDPNYIDWDTTITNTKYIIEGLNQIKPVLQNLGPLISRLRGNSTTSTNRKSKISGRNRARRKS